MIHLVGGNSVEEDVEKLNANGGNIIICTPGRLEDLLTRRKDLNLASATRSLVVMINVFTVLGNVIVFWFHLGNFDIG